MVVPGAALMSFRNCLFVFGLSMSSDFVTLVTDTPLKEHAAVPKFDVGDVQYSIRFPKPGSFGEKGFLPVGPESLTGDTVDLASCSSKARIVLTTSS